MAQVLPLLSETFGNLLKEKLVSRFEYDVYVREIERYGGIKGIELSETLFAIDSESCLSIQRILQDEDDEDLRWKVVLLGIESLFRDFAIPVSERLAIVSRGLSYLEQELSVDGAFKESLGREYRTHRAAIETLLSESTPEEPALKRAMQIFEARSAHIRELAIELEMLEAAKSLSIPLPDLVGSYVHMHVNRGVQNEQLRHELILYDFLRRCYTGKIARIGRRRSHDRDQPSNVIAHTDFET